MHEPLTGWYVSVGLQPSIEGSRGVALYHYMDSFEARVSFVPYLRNSCVLVRLHGENFTFDSKLKAKNGDLSSTR